MANAVKQANGKWKCTAFLGRDKQGKQIRKVFYGATKKEAENKAKECELVEKKSINAIDDRDITVINAIDRFIIKKEKEVDKGSLSPATVLGYKSMRKNLYNDIANIPVLKITDAILNEWIDSIEEEHSAKTCKNAWSLCRSSLIDVLPRHVVLDWRIELPKITREKVNVPLENDIHILLNYVRSYDYDMYMACLLAAFGTLRRSEICALDASDIDREECIVHINKALVMNDQRGWVLKTTKTELSKRDVKLPVFVINALPESGKIIGINPSRVSDRFAKYLRRLDLHFRFHDLRHYSASIMHELGASDVVIQHRGGWSNNETLNKHYKGTMDEYESKFTEKLNNHFESRFAI